MEPGPLSRRLTRIIIGAQLPVMARPSWIRRSRRQRCPRSSPAYVGYHTRRGSDRLPSGLHFMNAVAGQAWRSAQTQALFRLDGPLPRRVGAMRTACPAWVVTHLSGHRPVYAQVWGMPRKQLSDLRAHRIADALPGEVPPRLVSQARPALDADHAGGRAGQHSGLEAQAVPIPGTWSPRHKPARSAGSLRVLAPCQIPALSALSRIRSSRVTFRRSRAPSRST